MCALRTLDVWRMPAKTYGDQMRALAAQPTTDVVGLEDDPAKRTGRTLTQVAPGVAGTAAWRGPRCHPGGITGYGSLESGVVVVGIAPGRNEIQSGTPFIGQSGKLLDAILKYTGFSRADIYTTNLLCWYNNEPTPQEILKCHGRFMDEIAAARPKVIVTMGAIPTEALTSRKVGSVVSQAIWSNAAQCYIVPTYHPSGVLRGAYQNVSDIIHTFRRVRDVLGWEPFALEERERFNWTVIGTRVDAQYTLDTIARDCAGTDYVVSCDIETTSTEVEESDIWVDQLFCVGVYVEPHDMTYVFPAAVYMPDEHGQGLRWPTQGVRWSFHGGAYDVPGLIRYLGTRLPIVEDTMLQSYSIDERPGHHKLKSRVREYVGASFWEEAVDRRHLERAPAQVVYQYNAHDAVSTGKLVHSLETEQNERRNNMPGTMGSAGLYRDLLIPAANVFVDTQLHGVRIDQDKVRELSLEWFPKYLDGQTELQEMARQYGWKGDLNLNSAPQKSNFIYGVLGLPAPKTEPGHLPTTERMQLEKFAAHPWVARWLQHARLAKVVETYLLGTQDDVKIDGRVHPRAQLHSTATGRRSYLEPPVQTLPQDYTVGADLARIREIFAADEPGIGPNGEMDEYDLVEADYNQIEVWVAQHLCQDEQLLADLLTGDVHGQTAQGVFHIDKATCPPLIWKERRQNAKKIRFGLMYQEGADKLSLPAPIGINCTRAEAQHYINEFWARYPQHWQWCRDIEYTARKTGRIVTPTGRQRRFHLVLDNEQLRQAINFPVQSIASDYALMSIIEMHQALLRLNCHILFEVHDSIVINVSRKHREEALRLVKRTMEAPKPMLPGFPCVKVDMKIGPNLGEVKPIAVTV